MMPPKGHTNRHHALAIIREPAMMETTVIVRAAQYQSENCIDKITALKYSSLVRIGIIIRGLPNLKYTIRPKNYSGYHAELKVIACNVYDSLVVP